MVFTFDRNFNTYNALGLILGIQKCRRLICTFNKVVIFYLFSTIFVFIFIYTSCKNSKLVYNGHTCWLQLSSRSDWALMSSWGADQCLWTAAAASCVWTEDVCDGRRGVFLEVLMTEISCFRCVWLQSWTRSRLDYTAWLSHRFTVWTSWCWLPKVRESPF